MNLAPSRLFSEKCYKKDHSNLLNRNTAALLHFEIEGKKKNLNYASFDVELISDSPYFNPSFYKEKYNVDASSTRDLAENFLLPSNRMRHTSSMFLPSDYLHTNKDIAESGMNPLLHYLLYGKNEGCKGGVQLDLSNKGICFKNYTNPKNREVKFNRICLFACFFKDGLIDDSVMYLLRQLQLVSDAIVLIGDCGIRPTELSKLSDIVYFADFIRHNEYDFGSYKRAFFYAQKEGLLENVEEILFCNDSIIGPVGNIQDFFKQKEEDGNPNAYGITINNYGFKDSASNNCSIFSPHIQTYFFTVSKEIFQSTYWIDFMASVKQEQCKAEVVINYEMGMSKLIENNGHTINSMYKTAENELGINPASQNAINVLSSALFIKKNVYVSKAKKLNSTIDSILTANSYPLSISKEVLQSSSNTINTVPILLVSAFATKSNYSLTLVSKSQFNDLSILTSSNSSIDSFRTIEMDDNEIYNGLRDHYSINGYYLYSFSIPQTIFQNYTSLIFLNNKKMLKLGSVHSSTLPFNFMDLKRKKLFSRIEGDTLHINSKKDFIIEVLLSKVYSLAHKKLFIKILCKSLISIDRLFSRNYSIYTEKDNLTCDNAYKMFENDIKTNKYAYYLVSNPESAHLSNNKFKKNLVMRNSQKHVNLFCKAKYMTMSFTYKLLIPKQVLDIHQALLDHKLIYVSHGISAGDKNSVAISAANGSKANAVFCCSKFEKDYFEKIGHESVYLVGYPRMDKWANNDNLNPDSCIIFFTWRKSLHSMSPSDFIQSSYVSTILNLITALKANKPNLSLNYFIHNAMDSNSLKIKILMAKINSIHPNVNFINNNDTEVFNNLFNQSQFLITDYSSVGYDFSYYKNRFPIFYMPEGFTEGHYTTTPLFEKICVGPIETQIDGVLKNLEISKWKDYKHLSKKFFNFHDSNNSERSIATLRTLIN